MCGPAWGNFCKTCMLQSQQKGGANTCSGMEHIIAHRLRSFLVVRGWPQGDSESNVAIRLP